MNPVGQSYGEEIEESITRLDKKMSVFPPKITEHVIHCCGYAVRFHTGIVGPDVPLGQEIDWAKQEKIACRHCGQFIEQEISGVLMAAYRLGGWAAITEPPRSAGWAWEAKLIDLEDNHEPDHPTL